MALNGRTPTPATAVLADYSGANFTEEERKFLRRMMEEEKRIAWFWALIRKWAFWTAALATGIITFRENIKAIILWLAK